MGAIARVLRNVNMPLGVGWLPLHQDNWQGYVSRVLLMADQSIQTINIDAVVLFIEFI